MVLRRSSRSTGTPKCVYELCLISSYTIKQMMCAYVYNMCINVYLNHVCALLRIAPPHVRNMCKPMVSVRMCASCLFMYAHTQACIHTQICKLTCAHLRHVYANISIMYVQMCSCTRIWIQLYICSSHVRIRFIHARM